MTSDIYLSYEKDRNTFNELWGIALNISKETIKDIGISNDSELLDLVVTILSHEHLHEAVSKTEGSYASKGLDYYLDNNMQTVRARYLEKDGITPKRRKK